MTRLRRTVVTIGAWYVGVTIGWLIVAGCREPITTSPWSRA